MKPWSRDAKKKRIGEFDRTNREKLF